MTSMEGYLATAKSVFRVSQPHAQSPDLLPLGIKTHTVLSQYTVNWDLHSQE